MQSIASHLRVMLSSVVVSGLFFLPSNAIAAGHECEIQVVSGVDEATSNAACLLAKIDALAIENESLREKVASIELVPGPRGETGPVGPSGSNGPEFVPGMLTFNALSTICPQEWRPMGSATIDLKDNGQMLGYLKENGLYKSANVSDEQAAAPGYDLVRVYLCLFE
ncbi:MAG: collagen-like triple helix repeat-containing protein [Pelagimonas sp.]|uniref:collagen-like triple helix repeat-containing protein n=1 Tax=Pelagimonas sp. TaxID=2073170 RepID=UPI003D6BDFE7